MVHYLILKIFSCQINRNSIIFLGKIIFMTPQVVFFSMLNIFLSKLVFLL